MAAAAAPGTILKPLRGSLVKTFCAVVHKFISFLTWSSIEKILPVPLDFFIVSA